jgi:glycosyltransferase involved in cell wall biosynthesis
MAHDAGTARLSIIIPVFNCSAYIGACLESVMRQRFTEWECIVINDGSEDGPALERAIAPYRTRIRYIEQANAGVSAARNAGLRIAQAPYVAFVDADNVLYPDFLQALFDLLAADPGAVLAFGNARLFGDHPSAGQLLEDVQDTGGELTFARLLRGSFEINSNLVARREAVIAAGLFDAQLRRNEDFDLWLRMLYHGGRVAHTSRVLMGMRLRPDGLSADGIAMTTGVLHVLAKCESTMTLGSEERLALAARRHEAEAYCDLIRGKSALAAGRYGDAVVALTRAHAYYRTPKLRFVIGIARFAPGLIPLVRTVGNALFAPPTHSRSNVTG